MKRKVEGVTMYDVESLSKLLKLSEKTVRVYLNKGKLQGRRIGTRWFCSAPRLQDFLTGQDKKER